jgi:chemotaxis protein MotA
MATAPQQAPGSAGKAAKSVPEIAAKPAKGAGAKRTSVSLDISTLVGIGIALAGIIGGLILERGSVLDIAQSTAAMIVLGGTFGAVLITTPFPVVMRAFRGLGRLFLVRTVNPVATSEELVQYAIKARKNGIVSLESEAQNIADPFLRKALNLAVDGTDLQELRKMMEIDIVLTEQNAEAEAKVWEAAGGYAPTIGIIGAVLGLIQVMKHLEDIKEVGHGIAVAFVATVYGVGSANIFFLPAASKLRARIREVTVIKDMMLEGVVGIVEGLNPTLIRLKLQSYDPQPVKRKAPKGTGVKEGNGAGKGDMPGPVSAPGKAAT